MSLPHILLVDDDVDTNLVIAHWIKKEHLASTLGVALNGEEALIYLKNNPIPDVILLDINMPRMNGWEFLEEYKKLPNSIQSSSTIIIVTVSENPDDKKKTLDYDIRFVNKPLTAALLKDLLQKESE